MIRPAFFIGYTKLMAVLVAVLAAAVVAVFVGA